MVREGKLVRDSPLGEFSFWTTIPFGGLCPFWGSSDDDDKVGLKDYERARAILELLLSIHKRDSQFVRPCDPSTCQRKYSGRSNLTHGVEIQPSML